jgi:hypothetical protein
MNGTVFEVVVEVYTYMVVAFSSLIELSGNCEHRICGIPYCRNLFCYG